MEFDLTDPDGVIESTVNIPDALWTAQNKAQVDQWAASRGFTYTTFPSDSNASGVQKVTSMQALSAWISAQGTASGIAKGTSSGLVDTTSSAAPAQTVPVANGGVSTGTIVAIAAVGLVGAAIVGWLIYRS